MSENENKIDIRSLPFEERTRIFSNFVQLVGLGIGGDEEYDLRHFGRTIVEFHSAQTEEDKEEKRKDYSEVLQKLNERFADRPEISEAVLNITLAEIGYF